MHFSLPDLDCRRRLLSLYFDSYVLKMIEGNTKKTSMKPKWIDMYSRLLHKGEEISFSIGKKVMDQEQLNELSIETEGFSGREIGKLMLAIQSSLYSSENGALERDLVYEIVRTKVGEHAAKRLMLSGNQKRSDAEGNIDYIDGMEHDLTINQCRKPNQDVKAVRKRYSLKRYGSFSLPN